MRRLNVTNSESGFTLLEQLIVLVLVGILGAFSGPSFMGMKQRQELNEAVSSLRSSLQEVQRQAIMKSTTCIVELPATDTDSSFSISSFTLSSYDLPAFTLKPNPIPCLFISNSPLKNVKITHYYEDANPTNKIQFDFRGNNATVDDSSDPLSNTDNTIILEHKDNVSLSKKCVYISPLLGLVRVGDYDNTLDPPCVAAQ